MSKNETEKIVELWNQKFVQATNFDSWGQMVEASEEYWRLARMLKSSASTKDGTFNENKCKVLRNIASCLEVRAKSLELVKSHADIELAEIKQLGEVLKNLLEPDIPEIPEGIKQQMNELSLSPRTPSPMHEFPSPENGEREQSVSQLNTSSFNSLLPQLPLERDLTLITVKIEKIGLKDAFNHIDPYFVVSCKDASGVDLCTAQKTPTATQRDDTYLFFGIDVELQVYVEKMPRNSAIFFEMKHYKPNKRMTSLKCFAFMEQDELKPGPCVIELYKKPIDYKRKKLALLTSKPLYLHLDLSLHTA